MAEMDHELTHSASDRVSALDLRFNIISPMDTKYACIPALKVDAYPTRPRQFCGIRRDTQFESMRTTRDCTHDVQRAVPVNV